MNTHTQSLLKGSKCARALALLSVALVGWLANVPLQAADVPAASSVFDAGFRDYIESLRADLKSGKVTIYSRVMRLNENEAKVFWPVYQQYETELFALGDRRMESSKVFVKACNEQTLDNATAKSLTKEWFAQQEDRLKLLKKYQKRFEKELNVIRAGQFLQIENRINALLDVMIASEIPLVDTTSGAKAAAKP